MLNGLYILDRQALDLAYGDAERLAIAEHVRMIAEPQTKASVRANPAVLAGADVIFSGWGMPVVDEAFLDAAPNLRAIFYAAGAVGSWMTEAVLDRGVVVTTAQSANSIPVAEYSLAMILLSLKHTFRLAAQARLNHAHSDRNTSPGCYGSIVGLVSFGEIARVLRDRLRPSDLRVLVYDPHLSAEQAADADVELMGLDELFVRSDVVSVHTPVLPDTVGMITGTHLDAMKLGATFINTARGAVVREDEMLATLARRPDLQAILDVAAVEPPLPHSPIYTLPNVLHTPHIAGSAGPAHGPLHGRRTGPLRARRAAAVGGGFQSNSPHVESILQAPALSTGCDQTRLNAGTERDGISARARTIWNANALHRRRGSRWSSCWWSSGSSHC